MRQIMTVLLISLLSLSFAQDTQENPLEVSLEAFLVSTLTKDDGSTEEQFTQAETARPGQIVEYRVSLVNVSENNVPAGNAVVTGPVPAGTSYLEGSATASSENALLEFSADGGQRFGVPPIMITVVNDEGEEEEVIATPDSYTATRWTVTRALAASESIMFIYRVVVQ